MFKYTLFFAIALATFTNNLFAQNEPEHPIFSDDWIFRLGAQHSDADAKIGLGNSEIGQIPVINLGEGDANTTVNSFGANVLWQAPERWSIGFSYFLARVENESLSSEDRSFGDLVIPAGTGLRTDFDTDFYVLNGYYDFFKRKNKSAGIGLGIYALDLSVGADLLVGGQPVGEAEGADTLAPLPTISAYYKHGFNENWAFSTAVSYFAAEIDKYDGDVLSADISLEYWPDDNWGFGVGYTFVDIEVEVDEDLFDQLYVVEYDSFFIFATFGF